MTLLVLGLLVFFGTHSVRIVAEDWRERQMLRLGEKRWKGLLSLVALVGFVLIVVGYGQARPTPVELWNPPLWSRHFAALLTLPAFVLLAAAYVPRTHIKAALGHPMLAGTKLWAFAHLIANGGLADVLLFGGFLAWSVVAFVAARRRDRLDSVHYPAGDWARDLLAVGIGLLAWAGFVKFVHVWLIGVAPFATAG